MSSLVVLAFPDEHGAQNVLTLVNDLQKQRLLTIDDAATVVRGRDGKPKVQQATSLVGDGAWGGAFWGMLLGLLFFVPFLGLALGAVTGALMGKFRDVGIDDRFIREVQEKIQPGQSALFLLVREVTLDRVLAALQPYHPEVLQTSLSAEQEARLREALGGAPAEAVAAVEAAVADPAAGAADGATRRNRPRRRLCRRRGRPPWRRPTGGGGWASGARGGSGGGDGRRGRWRRARRTRRRKRRPNRRPRRPWAKRESRGRPGPWRRRNRKRRRRRPGPPRARRAPPPLRCPTRRRSPRPWPPAS